MMIINHFLERLFQQQLKSRCTYKTYMIKTKSPTLLTKKAELDVVKIKERTHYLFL